MANLLPVSTYGDVYQIETSDPVLGGPGGIANRQPQQLANRDEWLKNQIEELQNDPVLSALATLIVNAAGKIIYSTGTNTFALSTITAFARTLLDDANASAALSTLGVSGFIKTLLDDADAATARGTLGIDTAISNAIAALVDSSPEALNTLDELAAALGDDPNFATTITNALAAKAPLSSPAFTNNPTAPTQASGNNSTRLATTEFVQAALTALGAVLLTGNQIIAGVKTFNNSPIVPDGTANGQAVHYGQFSASMNDNGYQKLPGGMLFQWGSVAIGDGSPLTGATTISATFPIPFPNSCFHVYPSIYGDQQSAEDTITVKSQTTSGVTFTAIVTGVSKTAKYFAVGK